MIVMILSLTSAPGLGNVRATQRDLHERQLVPTLPLLSVVCWNQCIILNVVFHIQTSRAKEAATHP